ncbi:MAG TPA: head GIN domain-containing protein [Sphingomonas sp.]|nr:head GIN domain-containing protein [Sphingomonas sp.]
MRSLMLLAILPLVACSGHGVGHDENAAGVPASGAGTARTYAVTGFTGIELKGSDDAEVRVGDAFSVRAQGPADMLDDLRIEKDGDTLKIGRKSNHFSWGGGGRDVKVFVTMPRIASAGIAGSGDMTIDRVDGPTFSGGTSGSGELSIGRMAVDSADLSIAGSGNIAASGTAQRVSLSIAGSGDIDAQGLTAREADVSTAGSGDIKATVNGHAKVSMMGSGNVDLGGGATCDVSKMGSGEVTCGH